MRSGLESIILQSKRHAEETLSLQAAASVLPDEIANFGSHLSEVTAEGYPGNRFHSGAQVVDEVESWCIQSAKATFGARYANVQSLSCSMANIAAYTALLNVGDRILSLDLKHGGHLSHGASMNLTSKLYETHSYIIPDETIDYDHVRDRALETKPNMIICGASAYPRMICYKSFREIADEVGALLLADISHVSGIVASGKCYSPIDYAHVTTTSTYKQLYGPRGGLILSGKDFDCVPQGKKGTVGELVDKAVFPGFQGTPDFRQIAQKAFALDNAQSPQFKLLIERVLILARELSQALENHGLSVVTGGTDTHMVLLDLTDEMLDGDVVERELESLGILANRNLVPNDTKPPHITSGVRFGTNVAAYRGLDGNAIKVVGEIISSIVRQSSDNCLSEFKEAVHSICNQFPLRDAHANGF